MPISKQTVAIIVDRKRKKKIGALGEALVLKHLKNKGFTHLQSNFLRRQGELDLILEFNGIIHFIEVKTVSRVNFKPEIPIKKSKIAPFVGAGMPSVFNDSAMPLKPGNVTCETSKSLPDDNVTCETLTSLPDDNVTCETLKHLPEENVSPWKMRKLARVVQIYLGEGIEHKKKWQFDVAVVYLDIGNKKAYIKFIKDIPLAA